MKRTALFLKEEQLEKLQRLSEKTGAPIAELVRRAIDVYLLSRKEGTEVRKAAIYCRVSTGDQHLETQLLDLRELAKQRGLEVVREYSDVISGAKSKRAGLRPTHVRMPVVIGLTLYWSLRLTESLATYGIFWKSWTSFTISTSSSSVCGKTLIRVVRSDGRC